MRRLAGFRRSMAVGAVWVVFYLAGCSGDAGGGESGPPGAFTFMKARAQLRAMVHCRARYETCPGEPPTSDRALTAERCLRLTVDEWQQLGEDSGERFGLDPAVLQAIDAGAIEYDAEAAGACLDGFRSYVRQLSCIQTRRLESLVMRGVVERDVIPSCSEVVTPKTEEGEACETDRECVDDLVCRRTSEDSGDCGKCRPPEGGGTATASGFTYVREGESCGSPNHTPTCDPTAPLLCESNEAGGWTCQPEATKEKGEACHTFGSCKEGLTCRDGTCQSFEIVDAGQPCGAEDVFCDRPRVCRSTGGGDEVCATVGRSGDACREDADCVGDLWCGPLDRGRSEAGECTVPIAEGERCESGGCADGLTCRWDTDVDDQTCQQGRSESNEKLSTEDCRP